MPSFAQMVFGWSLDPIMAAYDTGRIALDQAYENSADELAEHIRQVEDAKVNYPFDDLTGNSYRINQFAVEAVNNLEDAQNRHAQAFCIMLYHAFEKFVLPNKKPREGKKRKKGQWDKFLGRAAFEELAQDGWQLDIDKLDKLRLVVNCIKHNECALFKRHPDMFPPTVGQIIDKGAAIDSWDDLLIIKREDVLDFEAALRSVIPLQGTAWPPSKQVL